MTKSLRELWSDTSGGTIVEYTLILVLIAVISIAAIRVFGTTTASSLSSSAHAI